ncbi:hypothetical protein ISS21_01230 [Patescibacteria group bacterium]|nr:hypothetical protein [Patescibacteria group bacterium]
MKYILYIYRTLLVVAFVLFFVWLLSKNVVIKGQLFLIKDFCLESSSISHLYPENRIGGVEREGPDECFQRIFVEPAYFRVKIPRTFAKVKARIVYANPDQPILQLGVMKKRLHPLDWRFTLKLLENKIFDNLDWFRITQEGVSLWQKQKRFDSLYEYVNNVPTDQKTVTFYYQFSPEAVKNPTKVVPWNPETPFEHVDYIISQYQSPRVMLSGLLSQTIWKEQTVEFLVGPDYMNDHYLEFIISAPGLTSNRYEIKVKRIEVELSRPPTDWPSFFSDLKGYFLRKLSNVKSKLH